MGLPPKQTHCQMQSHRAELNMQCTPAGAEEGHQDSKELFNETGVPVEPFNLDREREEGHFDAGGGYIPHNFPQVKDAWLESVDSMSLSLSQLSWLECLTEQTFIVQLHVFYHDCCEALVSFALDWTFAFV